MVLTFKLADDVVSSLKNVLLSRGFAEFIEHHHYPNSWNFQWKTTRYSDREAIGPEERDSGGGGSGAGSAGGAAGAEAECATRQKINHFQKTTGICRKDTLARNLRRMQKTYGSVYSFSPQTFILPRELAEFEGELEKARGKGGETVWICKPSSSSQGKNIFLIRKREELQFDCSFVVQRYIANPMLIGGYKYDLRIYILVTSFRPLCVYMYREGLARFSSQKYDPSDTSNLFSHLTNASINKASPDLLTDKDVIGSGCKWTVARWFDYLESIGCNPYSVWERIKDIAILTLLPIVSEVPDNTRCFELFGFDIMLDEEWKPWIIEVNASPAIAISGLQDTQVKIPLLNDLLDAIGFPSSASLDEASNTSNLLPSNHVSFDPTAEAKSIQHAIDALHAAQQAKKAQEREEEGDDGDIVPGNNGSLTLNAANRGHQVQRVPRIVKMMTQKGRDQLEAKAAKSAKSAAVKPTKTKSSTATAAAPAASSSRRPAAVSIPSASSSTRIPRPSQSPVGRPGPSSSSPDASPIASSPEEGVAGSKGGETPSRIPVRRKSGVEETPTVTATATGTTGEQPPRIRAVSAQKPAVPSASTSAARTSSTGVAGRSRPNPVRSVTLTGPLPTVTSSPSTSSASNGRSRTRAPASSLPSSSPSLPRASTSVAPTLIGDFERIFPFDSTTALASDGIATAQVLRGGKGSTSSSASMPLPLLFAEFSKTTVNAIKARVRAREKIEREKAQEKEKQGTPMRRFAFTETSRMHSPTPWTLEAIQSAVDRAKDAAKRERARLGLPEPPPAAGGVEVEKEDESVQVELAIRKAEEQKQQAAAAATAPSAASA